MAFTSRCTCACRCGVARNEHDELTECTETRLALYCSGFWLKDGANECPVHPRLGSRLTFD